MSMEEGKGLAEASIRSSGHNLSPMDPESPMNWPLLKRIYVSAVAFSFAFVILYGTTTYTAAISAIPDAYGVSMRLALLGFTMPFFGVAFAPIWTPHVAEKYGRRPVYLASFPLFTLCVVVIGLAPNFSTVLAFRFFAGFFGGPCLVLIEGTFADVWSASTTVTYYSFLNLASYSGAAFGPVIGGFVFLQKGPAWLSWVTLLFATIAMAFGAAMPETYGREIMRQRNRYTRNGVTLQAAQSGTTIPAMAKITFFTPLKMLVTEPIVIMVSLYLGLNFAVVFQWFISVPVALNGAYGFDVSRAGLAFLGAFGGAVMAIICSSIIEALTSRVGMRNDMTPIENRLFPAMFGGLLLICSLFWVGWTVNPSYHYLIPIFGTAIYVWGNAMVLISFISYVFDAYSPAGTLSALTAAASFRLICAGIIPIFILDMITGLTAPWAFGTFGFISLFMLTFPFILYFTGAKLRERSPYSHGGMSFVEMEMAAKNNGRQATPEV